MKTYKKFLITSEPSNNDLVSGLLWQLDIDGINETENGIVVFADSSKNITRDDIGNILKEMISERLIESFYIFEETLEDKNWNEEYEKNVRVIEVTEKIVIKPSFKEYISKPDQIIITIDPKMSFGTGEHATTKLVLQLIEKYVSGGEKVLDVGSGTAVLGIASVMLGAVSALCIDNDEWCVLNGNENVKANDLEGKVEIRLAEIQQVEEKEFDLIAANINKHILLDIAEELKVKIKKNGVLILSGLLIIDENDIVEKYTRLQFKLIEKITMDEWCALVFQLY
ncbi:MAG: 50S ribosomal protein L11 methyltransferase [Ignavibacteriales bacterium]|nr:50S ribosomal protein L11 methyltransferase [Ignavibacteriales bacterium]